MATHSPQVFRPRPLDIDTPMLVVIQNDPDDEEELKNEKKFNKKRRDKIIPIPIPVYKDVENYEKENSEWRRPDSYVIYQEKSPGELEETVEYEMDSEDERFMQSVNGASTPNKGKQARAVPAAKKAAPSSLLSEDSLEKMIDVLEKEAFRKIHQIPGRSFLDYLGNMPHKKKSGPKPTASAVLKDIEVTPPPDDVPCVVCKDEDWDEGNMIVFCEGCDLAVHQTCYGVPQIPRADWYCRRCERMGRGANPQKPDADGDEKMDDAEKSESVKEEDSTSKKGDTRQKFKIKDSEEESEEEFRCVLCGHTGGAVKPTADGKWAHVLCALWLPDAAFMDATIMEPIDTSGISKDRFGLSCEICGTREGCCIQCRTRYCYTAFHPFCAANADLLMEMRPAKGRPNNLLFKTHCTIHSKEIRAERGLETTDKYASIMNQVCSEEIKVGLHHLVGVPLAVADAVCNFWLAKRQKAKHKDRPLISRLQMDEDAIRHALKKKRSTTQRTAIQTGEEYSRLRELRRQMDRALIILDVLKKREMYKRDHTRKLQEILDVLTKANEHSSANEAPTTPKKSSTSSTTTTTTTTTTTSPSTTSSTTAASPKKTPTKSTQLTLDKFFSAKKPTKDTDNSTETNTATTSSPSKQRKLRDRATINPAPLPYAIPPTLRSTPIRRPPPSPTTSSSDESLSLPHTTRSGKSPDPKSTPDTFRRLGTPERAIRSRRSKSPAARRSLSSDLKANSDDEGEELEADEEEQHSSEGGSDSESGMVPKSRAHLRRGSANKTGSPTISKKRKRKV